MQEQDELDDGSDPFPDLVDSDSDSDSDSDDDDEEEPPLRERRRRWRAWDEEHQRSQCAKAGGMDQGGKRKKRKVEQPGTRQARGDGARRGIGSQQVCLDPIHTCPHLLEVYC